MPIASCAKSNCVAIVASDHSFVVAAAVVDFAGAIVAAMKACFLMLLMLWCCCNMQCCVSFVRFCGSSRLVGLRAELSPGLSHVVLVHVLMLTFTGAFVAQAGDAAVIAVLLLSPWCFLLFYCGLVMSGWWCRVGDGVVGCMSGNQYTGNKFNSRTIIWAVEI